MQINPIMVIDKYGTKEKPNQTSFKSFDLKLIFNLQHIYLEERHKYLFPEYMKCAVDNIPCDKEKNAKFSFE